MIVLDSSFLVAYHNSRDSHHAAARDVINDLLDQKWGPLLLPEYVFLEVLTVLARRVDIRTATEVGEILLHAKELEFVPCLDFFPEAFAIFKNQRNNTLSFADAAIVAIARARDAKFLATFDSGFQTVEGLTTIPCR